MQPGCGAAPGTRSSRARRPGPLSSCLTWGGGVPFPPAAPGTASHLFFMGCYLWGMSMMVRSWLLG